MFKKKENSKVSPGNVTTTIGSDMEFEGTLVGKGGLHIDGTVNGDIQVQGDIMLAEKGKVTGNIKGRHAIIAGKLLGNVELEGVLEITATGRLDGDIKVGDLIIREGANFRGNCTMQQELRSVGINH